MTQAYIRPLAKKTFYLDLKGSPYESTLSKDLKLLGAKQDPVFSREVSFVVSNRVPLRTSDARPKSSKLSLKSQNWSPLTPKTTTMSSSPQFLNDCSVDYMDSTVYTNSPVTDQNPYPVRRGMAMVQKATFKKQGTTDIIEVCRRLNVKIYNVEKIVLKVKKLKNLYSAQYAAAKKKEQKKTQSVENVRKLLPPFIKVEDTKRAYKTEYREFTSWTNVIDTALSYNVSQLFKQFKKSGNIDGALKPVLGEISVNKCHPKAPAAIFSPAFSHSLTKSFNQLSETPKASNSTTFSVIHIGKRKLTENALSASKKRKVRQRKTRNLYCEICRSNYTILDDHLKSEKHMQFMSDPLNFLEIQNIVSSLPKRGDFLLSRSSLYLVTDDRCNEVVGCLGYPPNCLNNLHLENLGCSTNCADNLQLENLGYSANCENLPLENINGNVIFVNNYQFDSHVYPTQHVDTTNVPLEVMDPNAEPYSFLDPAYVSPSCTSPDSVLPYLEDCFDIKEILEKNDTNKRFLIAKNEENCNSEDTLPKSCKQALKSEDTFSRNIENQIVETLTVNVFKLLDAPHNFPQVCVDQWK